MKYRIEKRKDGVAISVDAAVSEQGKLMEAFQACSEGRCTCPTEEYRKLDRLHVEQRGDALALRLTARDGEVLDVAEIERCLAHTASSLRDDGKKGG